MHIWHQDRVWWQPQPLKRWQAEIGTRMTVIKLNNDALFIHSPVELTTQLQLELTTLGQVKVVVTPNHRHHLYLSDWWLAYRDALFFAPPMLEQKRTDLAFDDALGRKTPELWQGQLYQTLIAGCDSMEEVVFCDPVSKTLILGDTLSWLADGQWLASLVGVVNGCHKQPAMPYYLKRQFHDRSRLRQSIQEILTWPFDRIIFAHGKLVERDGKQVFADAFQWVLGQHNPKQRAFHRFSI